MFFICQINNDDNDDHDDDDDGALLFNRRKSVINDQRRGMTVVTGPKLFHFGTIVGGFEVPTRDQ